MENSRCDDERFSVDLAESAGLMWLTDYFELSCPRIVQ